MSGQSNPSLEISTLTKTLMLSFLKSSTIFSRSDFGVLLSIIAGVLHFITETLEEPCEEEKQKYQYINSIFV